MALPGGGDLQLPPVPDAEGAAAQPDLPAQPPPLPRRGQSPPEGVPRQSGSGHRGLRQLSHDPGRRLSGHPRRRPRVQRHPGPHHPPAGEARGPHHGGLRGVPEKLQAPRQGPGHRHAGAGRLLPADPETGEAEAGHG